MNDEYLWNKTGNDPEIESLEKALAVFRYREAAAPVTVAQSAVLATGQRRFRISFAFAFASFAIVAIVAAMWLRISSGSSKSESADEIVFVQQSADAPAADVTAPVIEPISTPSLNPDRQGRPTGNRRRNTTATSAAIRHRPKTKDAAPKDSIAQLTEEERFAYRQLMLALSITGSKLRIVQDAIDGTEATNGDDSKNQR
jgi:hypothetical protein